MRVSSTQAMARYIKQLNTSYDKQTSLFEQSNGSNLHRASDGSVRYSKYLRYDTAATENEQYRDNVKTAISWMKSADAAMVSMKDILETLKEKTIQAANDTNGETDLQAIAKDFKAKLQEVIALGNSQSGDSYLFGGQSDLKQPFTMLSEKQMCAVAKTLSDSQAAYFSGGAGSSTGIWPQMLGLVDDDGNTYYLDTTTQKIYSQDMVNNGYKENVASGSTGVSSSDASANMGLLNFSISDYFSSSGVMKTASANQTYTQKETTVITDNDGNTVANVTKATNKNGTVTCTVTDSSRTSYTGTGTSTTETDGSIVTEYKDDDGNTVITEKIGTDGSTVITYTGSTGTVTITTQSDGSAVVSSGSGDVEGKTSTVVDTGTASEWKATVNINDQEVNLHFKSYNQLVAQYSGDAKHFSIVKRNGSIDPAADTVNTTGQDLFGLGLYDNAASGNQVNGAGTGTSALNDMLCILAHIEAGDQEWLRTDGITMADAAHSKVLEAETTIAARQNVYESVHDMLEKQNEAITEDISYVSDTDVAKLATQLMTMQTIYNLSLSMGSRILPPSLADYLR